jgi:hypothetical protein
VATAVVVQVRHNGAPVRNDLHEGMLGAVNVFGDLPLVNFANARETVS